MYNKSITQGQNIYSFELIYSHGLVSKITSLSNFLLIRSERLLLPLLDKSSVLKKCFCFYQEIYFSLFTNEVCKFWKVLNSIIYGKKIVEQNQARFI